MVKVNRDVRGNELPCEVYLDNTFKENLDSLNSLVEKDWDGISITWGYEGDGKSVFEMQKNLYLDHNFNLDNIVFSPEQFEEAVDEATPFTAIMWDEADVITGNWWDKVLQSLKSKFKRIRSKNLFIGLVTPTIFDMDKYFIIHRTRFGIRVYSEGTTRGFFELYNRRRKKKLYLQGKRNWDMDAAQPNFKGRFTKLPSGFPVDWSEYERKKDLATQDMLAKQGLSSKERLVKYRRECLERLHRLLEEGGGGWSQKRYAQVFDVDRSNISRDFQKFDD